MVGLAALFAGCSDSDGGAQLCEPRLTSDALTEGNCVDYRQPPKALSTVWSGEGAQYLAVLGDHAFSFPCGSSDLVVLDLSEPSSPREVASLPLEGSGPIVSLPFFGDPNVVVAATAGFYLLSASNPANPQIIFKSEPFDDLVVSATVTLGGFLVVTKSSAHVVSFDQQLGVVISQGLPLDIDATDASGLLYNSELGGYAVIVGHRGSAIVRVATYGAVPTLVATFGEANARCVQTFGDQVLIGRESPTGGGILDLYRMDNPSTPALVRSDPMPEIPIDLDVDLLVGITQGAVLGESIFELDLSNLSRPVIGPPFGKACAGGCAGGAVASSGGSIVAANGCGVTTYSSARRSDSDLSRSFEFDASMADLAMSDGIAYLASDEGLFTVTLRGETFGTVNRSDETQRSLDDVAVARSCVVALDGGGSGPDSLVVYQLTHADVPEWMASLHLVTTGVALLAECDHAYVATGRSTLQVIDVSNPRQPSYTTEVVLPATVIDWVLSDHTIYATSRDGMVFNIDISRFWAPEVIDSLVVPNASSFDRDGILSVDGRRLLVANRSRGFARIEIGGAGELTLTEIIEDQVGYVGSILLDNEIVYVRGTPLSVFAFGDGGVLERLEALRLGHAHGAIVRDENLIALLDAKNPPGTRASLVVLPRQCSSELQ